MSYWDKQKSEIKSAVTELEKIANDSTEQTCEKYKNLIVDTLRSIRYGGITLNDEVSHKTHGYKTWYKGYQIYIISIKLDDNDNMWMKCTYTEGWEFIVTMPQGFTIDFKTSYETYNRQIAGGLFKEYIKNNIDKIMAENKEKILQCILNSVDIGQVKEQTY